MELLSGTLFTDPVSLLSGTLAVTLVGLSKGGFGGAMALLGVPILALSMPPVQAAAIMLPILLVMDAVSLWTWRRYHDWTTLKLMIPAGAVGIAIGWMAVSVTSDAAVRLIVGTVALLFVLRSILPASLFASKSANGHRPILAWFWGSIAGFTSFVAHAGGPPYQIYTMPLRMDPKLFTGTSVVFFAVVNAIKVVPYFMLGQFDATNLHSSFVMLPVAVLSTILGAALIKRMKAEIFYPMMYTMVAIVALKLMWDGISGL
ncbi:sulfite exporter TauE/SafE family protein [Qingshengfaniella alkalisoli]|uniref:Probable membrane transporter protein n=1 Tax=Qingshengfaniella alkalisoli TaxID=2599296 RepID=A0A5B8J041_9RHOB|nr:sulfite exporter TauE/SafE family protein [Qingshengfaniella alkalisoli]QDY71682.1 sulfite exporter TauE/SafE family protein [Qingshengfaniella alkalisoli]